jgi:succinyl-CoA synthetase beta subunit
LLDAKVNIDDSASYRQTELLLLKESTHVSEEIDPNEVKANEVGISYVGLQGNIGCMVNGAGLAMATMDLIKLKGGDPANFLDVGGSADEFQVTQAFIILSNHSKVKAILINIFGGIMKCDTIAKGIIKAAETTKIKIPIVVRLTGTNQEEGNKLIEEFSNKHKEYVFLTADDLDEAAEKAVRVAKNFL